jgi:hypothetical protein
MTGKDQGLLGQGCGRGPGTGTRTEAMSEDRHAWVFASIPTLVETCRIGFS